MALMKRSLNATEVVKLGTGHESSVSRIVFQVVDDGSMSTSAVVKGRIQGITDELIALPYVNRGTGASVAASTAITAEGLYEVDATGIEVVLDNTYASGAGSVYIVPVAG